MDQSKTLTFQQKAEALARYGYDDTKHEGAIAPPIFQTVMFSYDEGMKRDYVYTSLGNPTFAVAAKKLAAVEYGAAARLYSSGMAAIHGVLLSLLKTGDHIIATENLYGGVQTLLKQLSEKYGIDVTFVLGRPKEIQEALRSSTKMIYVESPSSKLFDILDLEAIGRIGKQRGIVSVIDNTWATPLFQNPILYGFDIVVHSTTKYLGGSNDTMGGVAIGSKKMMSRLWDLGAVMDPHQAWLLNRSLATLPMRMKHFMESAMVIAAFLETHPKILKVFYPGLASHPNYKIGKQQMSGYSSLLSFITKGDFEQSLQVMSRFYLIRQAWSYGGPTSIAMHCGKEYRAVLEQRGYPPNLIRLHVGYETTASLIADLNNALQAIP